MPFKPKVWVPILIFVASTVSIAIAHEFGQSQGITQNAAYQEQEDKRYNSILREMNSRANEREERTQEMFDDLKKDIRVLNDDVKKLIGHTHGP